MAYDPTLSGLNKSYQCFPRKEKGPLHLRRNAIASLRITLPEHCRAVYRQRAIDLRYPHPDIASLSNSNHSTHGTCLTEIFSVRFGRVHPCKIN
ncbi:hypothetical protein COL8621_00027 [Actibacterium lipolyticum]|uniref:Uncharacterized protein n=1 Tax=Actibacterium lipolyticum TaxID=1524263 RepID=A0A238JLJ8_9RHOB|nr:hypothetical protein COL8621_00027 [Actibacterium lipolyticum]